MKNYIDPENNLFSNINISYRYNTENQYNEMIREKNKISIIHFNTRRLYANFHRIKEYLSQFNIPFNIIAISETWINNEMGLDFELNGYVFNYIKGKNKSGGGVLIYSMLIQTGSLCQNNNLLHINTLG